MSRFGVAPVPLATPPIPLWGDCENVRESAGAYRTELCRMNTPKTVAKLFARNAPMICLQRKHISIRKETQPNIIWNRTTMTVMTMGLSLSLSLVEYMGTNRCVEFL